MWMFIMNSLWPAGSHDVQSMESHNRSQLCAARFDTEVIGSVGKLRSLAPEWRALWEACPGATVFQRPEWLIPWSEYFARDSLHVVTLRLRGRLIGLLPCWICRES